MVSVIIPVYNEEKLIGVCLSSLLKQSYKDFEVIVVDDGSTDKTLQVLSEYQISNNQLPIKIIKQNHLGPAIARNFGAKHAKGEILVFVDADMALDKDFITKLVEPIEKEVLKGTFTKEEFVYNWNFPWSRCWNYNQGIFDTRRIPKLYPDTSPVFRAVLKSEFERVGGFDAIGFTDDWTISRKLGYKAQVSQGAICFHANPESFKEVYFQAQWIGKNEFISGTIIRKILNILRYSILIQFLYGIYLLLRTKEWRCPIFQIIYGLGITRGIIGLFFGEQKNK